MARRRTSTGSARGAKSLTPPKSITPVMQWLVVCEAVEMDQEGGISFRRIFDNAQTIGFPIDFRFTVSVQFRGGTGEHKFWLTLRSPTGKTSSTPEISFWLASRAAAHRNDARVQMLISAEEAGRFDITAVLDGRDVITVPLTVTGPVAGAVGSE